MDYNDYTVMQGITGRLQARGYDWDYDAVSEHMHTQVQVTGHQYRQRQAELSQAQSVLGGALNQQHQLQQNVDYLGSVIQELNGLLSAANSLDIQLAQLNETGLNTNMERCYSNDFISQGLSTPLFFKTSFYEV